MQVDFIAFNGDADGICAAHQLQMAHNIATPVTGVKRDISLLNKIDSEQGKSIFVCDVAIEKNLDSIQKLLKQDCKITWFDHHRSGPIPNHPHFQSFLNLGKAVNTSWIVNQELKNRFPEWAIVGLFGDNMAESALQIAADQGLSDRETNSLKELGELFNYNAYGEDLSDLWFDPGNLLEQVTPFSSPIEFLNNSDILGELRQGYQDDMIEAIKIKEEASGVRIFPNRNWARRVIGVYANELIQKSDQAGIAIIQRKKGLGYIVSVRSKDNDFNAGEFCATFATGGGRIGAGGINHLEEQDIPKFIQRFQQQF